MQNFLSYFPITDATWIFFIVLCIILFAPMLMGRLRIPHIIGMVLSGIIIGPYGLNILARDASFELFGQVGLYYIMFLAGLEMDMEGLKKNSHRMAFFGLLTFCIPFLLVFLAGGQLLDYSRPAVLLLSCVMASNTLIAYPIVCKYGLQRHRSVTLSVGASMMALLMALLVSSGLSSVMRDNNSSIWWIVILLMAKLCAYCAAMAYLIPRITRWFLQHYSDAVTQFIFALGVLFLNAAITSFIGIEGVFGAFFAGLLLNRYIPRVSPLMARIEFTGNALFIPYFLIGVGMLIDIRMLFTGWHAAFIVTAIVVLGTLGKMIAAYAAGYALRLPLSNGHMLFGLTSAHAAGSIAIVMVGINIHTADGGTLVDSEMLNGIVMMILFTCIISSLVTEHASRTIVLAEEIATPEQSGDDEKILLPISNHESMEQLVNLAILMRNPKLNRGLIGLNVVLDDTNVERNQAQGIGLLEDAVRTASTADVRMQTQSRISTNVANGIMHAFKEYNASEIIMGLHETKSDTENFWGTFTESLFTELNRQIVIAQLAQPLNTIRRIQVAVPSRVEYEAGFHRWIDRLARLAANLDCLIQFHGRQDSLSLINSYIQNIYPEVRADYTAMPHWIEVGQMMSRVNDDHLLVVITARKSTVSYKTAFEKLPAELRRYYKQKNLMIIFPDQYGEPADMMSFTAPQKGGQVTAYAKLREWLKGKN
ncbi:MAG: cation:proton antiporter [Prevotella sp.]|nr:cation:proton antiporter [Prevotella sp.]